MAIIGTELKFFRSVTISDAASNGGRMNPNNQVISGVRNNILPNTTQTERDAGITRYRKIFLANRNEDDIALQEAFLHMLLNSPADDLVFLVKGDWRDIQSDINIASNVEWRGGVGDLETALTSGDNVVRVTFESITDPRIHPNTTEAILGNRVLWIGEGDPATSEVQEFVIWESFIVDGTEIVYTLASGVMNDYTVAAKVANVYYNQDGDVVPTVEDWTETAASTGTFDEATYPPVLENLGAVDDDWLITFTSPTAFTVEGVFTGSVGTGNTSSVIAPTNPGTSVPYFTIDPSGWAGTWTTGDTVEFTTRPAAVPLWVIQHVPENTPSFASNEFKLRFGGESAE